MNTTRMALKTFYIETHGCQMNEHDSEKIAGLLTHRGLTFVPGPEEADVYLLNTCSIREKAAQRVYSRLGELKAQKRIRPGFVIGVVGCVAQQEGEQMIRKAPHVDLVVGTHLYHTLPDLLDEIEANRNGAGRGSRVATDFLAEAAPVEIGPVLRQNRTRAHVTIMEGCNKHCAFCIVPRTRGRERSRPAARILEEVRRAADQGYPEILLLGQTVNSYKDPSNPRFKFADLLDAVARIPGPRRIRFTSPHPRHFDDDVIAVIAQHPQICDQVHLPLQSGSSRILRRMRRQHDQEWYLELIQRFGRSGRSIRFSTDIIVGFPGETEEDFEQTLQVVRQVQFESMFSFKYSPRPQTEASRWPDDVPEEEKSRRLALLQRLQQEIQLQIHRRRYLGQTFEVLTEGTARDGYRRFGRTTTNKVVNFEGNDPPGSFVQISVTDIGPHSLLGRKVLPTTAAAV